MKTKINKEGWHDLINATRIKSPNMASYTLLVVFALVYFILPQLASYTAN
jgi:hypothetical protein